MNSNLWCLLHWSLSSNTISSKRLSLNTAKYSPFVPPGTCPSLSTLLCSSESSPSWNTSVRLLWSLSPFGFANGKQWKETGGQEERKIWVHIFLAPSRLSCSWVAVMVLYESSSNWSLPQLSPPMRFQQWFLPLIPSSSDVIVASYLGAQDVSPSIVGFLSLNSLSLNVASVS